MWKKSFLMCGVLFIFLLSTTHINASASCQADINADYNVNLTDYSLLVRDFLKSNQQSPADINGDTQVNLTDYTLLVRHFLSSCSSDSTLWGILKKEPNCTGNSCYFLDPSSDQVKHPVRLTQHAVKANPTTPDLLWFFTGKYVQFTAQSDSQTKYVLSMEEKAVKNTTTTGVQKVLVIMYNFQNNAIEPLTKQEVYDKILSPQGYLNTYYGKMSNGALSVEGDIFGWYTIPQDELENSCSGPIKEDLEEALLSVGLDKQNYSRLVYIRPYKQACGGAHGSLAGNPSTLSLYGVIDRLVVIHEFGHNLSLSHANSMSCGSKAIDNFLSCIEIPYGDNSNVMGIQEKPTYLNLFQLAHLGWSDSRQIEEVTHSGNYRIFSQDTSGESLIKALRVKKPDTNEYYYIEFREPEGFDSSLGHDLNDGVIVYIGYYQTYFSYDKNNIGHLYNSPATKVLFAGGTSTVAMKDGIIFRDDINNITVTQLSHTSEYADVEVKFE